ncbi:hypothetical protein, partial [Bradyrhizobium liaoningense]|uniref:hypothetical protein n=1 Tax=Bradyrhizobium liaoningense TaxID=43992 RepID=UPI001BA67611
ASKCLIDFARAGSMFSVDSQSPPGQLRVPQRAPCSCAAEEAKGGNLSIGFFNGVTKAKDHQRPAS